MPFDERTTKAIENYIDRRKEGLTPKEIAKAYGISSTTIYKVVIHEAQKAHPEYPKEFFYECPGLSISHAKPDIGNSVKLASWEEIFKVVSSSQKLLEKIDKIVAE